MPPYSVGKVRLTWDLKGRAEIILEQGGRKAGFALSLERRGESVAAEGRSSFQVSVTARQNQPAGADCRRRRLTKPLEPIGPRRTPHLAGGGQAGRMAASGLAGPFTVFSRVKKLHRWWAWTPSGRKAVWLLPPRIRARRHSRQHQHHRIWGNSTICQVEIACSGRWQVVER